MKTFKVKKTLLFIFLSVFCCGLFCFGSASAVSKNDLTEKALLLGLKDCYQSNTYLKVQVINAQKGWEQLRGHKYNTAVVQIPTFKEYTHGTKLTCERVFKGDPGLIKITGKNIDFPGGMNNLGFSPASQSTGVVPIKISFKKGGKTYETNTLNMKVVNLSTTVGIGGSGSTVDTDCVDAGEAVECSDAEASIKLNLFGQAVITLKNHNKGNYGIGGDNHTKTCSISNNAWTEVRDCLKDYVESFNGTIITYSNVTAEPADGFKVGEDNATTFQRQPDRGYGVAVSYFSGGKRYKDIVFTLEDKLSLYNTYLKDAIDSGNKVSISNKCYKNKNENELKNKDVARVGNEWCVIEGLRDGVPNDAYHRNVAIVDNNNKGLHLGSLGSALDSIFKSSDYDNIRDTVLSGLSTGGGQDGPGGPGGDGDAETSQCHKASKKIGWILCAVLEGTADVIEGTYNSIERDFLVVKPSFFARESGTGRTTATYLGWKIFRDFANIIFAILFVIVIFSQLTGFGLDNYGVKKILPRLIMVAILVNLSFLICQGAVDISNILGAGLRNMFENLIPDNMNDVFTPINFASRIRTDLLMVAGGAGVTFALTKWDAWVMPLVLVLIVSVISTVFFFLLLGVRQAGIIIAVVIAPVAIVCYALPNTKKIFDRWYKIFSSLLLVYPIAGLLMGGGKFASTLLINMNSPSTTGTNGTTAITYDETGFIYNLVAMLISVVPFFFVPKMVQGSMRALGDIGTKIQRVGTNLGRTAERRIKGTEGYKDMQRRLTGIGSGQRGARLLRRQERLRANGRDLSAFNRRRMHRELGRHEAMVTADIESEVNNGRLLKEGTNEYENLMEATRNEARSKQSKEWATQYTARGFRDDLDSAGAEYASVLSEMATPGLDLNGSKGMELQSRAMALQEILAGSDSGRKIMQNTMSDIYAAHPQGGTSAGLRRAASLFASSYGHLYKDKDREFFNENQRVAAGKPIEGRYETVKVINPSKLGQKNSDGTRADIENVRVNTKYGMKSMNSMTAEKFANLDESGQLSVLGNLRAVRDRAQAKARADYVSQNANNPNAGSEFDAMFASNATAQQRSQGRKLVMDAMDETDRRAVSTLANNAESMLLNQSLSKDAKAVATANMVRQFDSEFGQTAYEAEAANATDVQKIKRNQRAHELGVNDEADTLKIERAPELPKGWKQRDSDGAWIDTTPDANGVIGRELNANEIARANNIQSRIDSANALNERWLHINHGGQNGGQNNVPVQNPNDPNFNPIRSWHDLT